MFYYTIIFVFSQYVKKRKASQWRGNKAIRRVEDLQIYNNREFDIFHCLK